MAKDQSALRLRIREIAHARPRFGYQRIHVMLRREGWLVNKKCVRRLYRLDGLQLRTRIRRRKHMCLHRGPVPVPNSPHERWSMDFVHDQLFDGRPFRILTVVDQLSRESPLLEVDFAMSGQRVAEALEARTTDMSVPVSITVDHGSEFTSKALEEWAWRRSVKLDIQGSAPALALRLAGLGCGPGPTDPPAPGRGSIDADAAVGRAFRRDRCLQAPVARGFLRLADALAGRSDIDLGKMPSAMPAAWRKTPPNGCGARDR